MTIKDLENKGELQLLIFLLENGKTKITDIKIDVAKSTVYHALDALSSIELIEEERTPPYTRYIQLTGDGKVVAKKLSEIAQILQAKREREANRASQ
jgi:predicted transcriptional regulator